jgi:hypothetical protein
MKTQDMKRWAPTDEVKEGLNMAAYHARAITATSRWWGGCHLAHASHGGTGMKDVCPNATLKIPTCVSSSRRDASDVTDKPTRIPVDCLRYHPSPSATRSGRGGKHSTALAGGSTIATIACRSRGRGQRFPD